MTDCWYPGFNFSNCIDWRWSERKISFNQRCPQHQISVGLVHLWFGYLVLEASSSELSSISNMSSVEGVELMLVGGVSSSRRGSPLCFFLRFFFFLAPPVLAKGGSGGSSGSSGSSSRFWLGLWSLPIQNRWLSVGMGEVARWAGTIS